MATLVRPSALTTLLRPSALVTRPLRTPPACIASLPI
jgi:hypothetical protein